MGISQNGERINNIRYADDTVIFTGSLEGLQQLMNRVTESSRRCAVDINVNKTKLMIVSKNKFTNSTLNINQRSVECVSKFTCFATVVNEQWDHSQETKSRIEKARAVYTLSLIHI